MLLPRSINTRLCCMEKTQAELEKRLNALDSLNVVNFDGPAFTLGAEDSGNYNRFSYFADGTVTVSSDVTTGTLGTSTVIFNEGVGNRTIIAGLGVTLNASSGSLILPPYAYATLIEVGPNEFDVLVATAGNPPVVPAPVVVNPPTVSGNRVVGQTLTATPATWTTPPAGGVTRQWFRDGVAIAGATNLTYVLVTADGGALVSVVDTGTNSGGSTASASTETEHVASLMASVASDVGSTPSTPRITLLNSQNAVRVWAGNTAATEAYFDLRVSRNGGTAYSVRMSRFGVYVLQGDASTVFSFATSDGRSLMMAPAVDSNILPISFPSSGTANSDKAGPPLWAPSAPHVTLPVNGSSFEIASTGSEMALFISEYDGTTWSPEKWLRLPAAGGIRYKASFKRVAICNYEGTALTVNAPTGSTVGGSSVVMHLPFETVTGVTHTPNSVATFKTAMAAAVAGDQILLADGTYAMDIVISPTTFAANHGVGGNVGAEGIMIRSASGNAAACIITGNTTGTNGLWDLGRSVFTASPRPFMMRDVTLNFSGQNAGFSYRGGKILLENVLFTGPQTGGVYDLISLGSIIEGYSATCLRCSGTDSLTDIWNAYGGVGITTGGVTLIDCIGARSGNAVDAQVVTTHDAMRLYLYGGTYSDAHTYVCQGDFITSPAWFFFVKTAAGARKAGLYYLSAFGCDFGGCTNNIAVTTGGYLVANRITTAAPFGNNAIVRESTSAAFYMSGNLYDLAATTSIASWFPNVNTSSKYRHNITLSATSVKVGSDTGSSTVDVTSNTSVGAGTAFDFNPVNLFVGFLGNAAKTSGTSIGLTAGGAPKITPKGYNVLDPTVSVNYTAGTGDTLGSDASLDANYFPISGGNCDGTATAAGLGLDYVGATDTWGLPAVYSFTTVDRGARARPRVISGAELLPCVW